MLRGWSVGIAHRKINDILPCTPFGHLQLIDSSKYILRKPLDPIKLYFVKHGICQENNCVINTASHSSISKKQMKSIPLSIIFQAQKYMPGNGLP